MPLSAEVVGSALPIRTPAGNRLVLGGARADARVVDQGPGGVEPARDWVGRAMNTPDRRSRKTGLFAAVALAAFCAGCDPATTGGNVTPTPESASPTPPPPTEPEGEPAASVFDPLVIDFMERYSITAGAVGFSKDGAVVYERAFGWMDPERTVPVPDDVMMRIMSVSKPFTAAAIHELARAGTLDLDGFAFDLGQPEGGVLELEPFPTLGDPRLAEITIRHLLLHRGGWSRDEARESWQRAIRISEAMSVPSPPGPRNTLRYILGESLVFNPGLRRAYSNNGYLVLQTIIEETSGQDYMSYLFRHVLAPLGIRSDDLIKAGTLPIDRSPREPWYDATNSPALGANVF